MSNPEYQRLPRCPAGALRERLPGSGPSAAPIARLLADLDDRTLRAAIRNLGADLEHRGSGSRKVGVWSATEQRDWFDDDAETILHWRERPTGQHFELGIAETNLVGLLGELGATWSRWGQPLRPIGVLYDPFVPRAVLSVCLDLLD